MKGWFILQKVNKTLHCTKFREFIVLVIANNTLGSEGILSHWDLYWEYPLDASAQRAIRVIFIRLGVILNGRMKMKKWKILL